MQSGRFAQVAATAKPIGAYPTEGCPFAMYQILSVTHVLMLRGANVAFQGRYYLGGRVSYIQFVTGCSPPSDSDD